MDRRSKNMSVFSAIVGGIGTVPRSKRDDIVHILIYVTKIASWKLREISLEMWRSIALAGLTLLVSCAAPRPSATSGPTARPDTTATTRRLQNSWHRCLEQSYRVTRSQTPDKNAAAEMAFQACSSEERDLASLPYSDLLMPHLKAETKHVLIEEGHLPTYP